MKCLFLVFMFPVILFAQDSIRVTATERIVKGAAANAGKGLFWALENIPLKKNTLESDLISDDKLIAAVRIEKGENGIRFESTGYYETCEVRIKIFKSNDRLFLEGYLKPDTIAVKPEKPKKK